MADEGAIGWQDAVARLTAEKERAEAAARIVKRFADRADAASAELTYAEGKAESDAVIAALTVALHRREPPESLDDLLERITKAADARAMLTDLARRHVAAAAGTKAVDLAALIQLAEPALAMLEAAVGALWGYRTEQDALTRKTIETQLQAAHWADFASLEAP
jgi:hypothetical protein